MQYENIYWILLGVSCFYFILKMFKKTELIDDLGDGILDFILFLITFEWLFENKNFLDRLFSLSIIALVFYGFYRYFIV